MKRPGYRAVEYVNRDSLRHLTGLGRDYAAFIEHIITNWEVDGDKPFPTGNLSVRRDDKAGEFVANFIPHDYTTSGEENVGGLKMSRQLMLTIHVERNGSFDVMALPLLMLLAEDPNYYSGYQLYQHDFVGLGGEIVKNASYIGITKRGWHKRWAEHTYAANSGSHYRFHEAIRRWYGVARVLSHHTIVACGLSENAAMALEESLVERDTLYPLGLNMVPGGRSGLAYLRKIGAIGPTERVAPDDRQTVINRFFERASRKGLSNPLAAANWLNPSYAESVICAGADRLKSQQIRDARFLSSLGHGAGDITASVGARNVMQIERLLSGATYSRIA